MPLSFQDKIKKVSSPTAVTPATPSATVAPATPATPPVSSLSFASKIKPVASPTTPAPEGGNMLGDMVKGLVSAPATMIARPFQAVQSAVQLAGMDIPGNTAKMKDLNDQAYALTQQMKDMRARGEDTTAIKAQAQDLINQSQAIATKLGTDANWKPSAGGIIAAAPENFGDVKKDVGRAIETVALGAGSPLASGAAFGFGSSLEQGNDVFSMQTLTSTLLGMGLGKAVDLIGKPLLNASGKVIGTITPQLMKDLVAKGSGAVTDFMANHEILNGAIKPLAEKITSGAQAFDNSVNKLFKGTADTVKGAVASQYPAVTKENIAKHYENTEVKGLMEPATSPGKTYSKASDVLKDAEKRGIDIEKTLADNKIYKSEHIEDGKWTTGDTADALADEAKNGGADFLRPALREAEPGVQRTPINEVRNRIISKIKATPDTALSPTQKANFIKNVTREYADNGAEAMAYKDGYGLEDLYNTKLQRTSGLYKEPKSGGVKSISDSLTSQQKRLEADAFNEILLEKTPKEVGLDKYFKAQEAKFVTANYLRTLNGSRAPMSLFQKSVRKVSQLAGGTLGFKTFGPMGIFNGYQFGGLMSDTFANLPNPIKLSYLKSISKTPPEIYQIMKEYVSEAQAKRIVTKLLKEGNYQTANYPAIPLGSPTTPPANVVGNNMTQNMRRLFNTPQLPAPAERTIVPNTQGTPNPIIAPYGAGGNKGDVGGVRQRLFKK